MKRSRDRWRDRADAAFRKAVYRRWGHGCFRCDKQATDVAHIVRRGYDRTRCDTDNARPLCNPCHVLQTAHKWEWSDLIGEAEYARLWHLANDPGWKRPADHWKRCLEELDA